MKTGRLRYGLSRFVGPLYHPRGMPDYDAEKVLAAKASLEFVRDGMTVGLGSGSTAACMIGLLAERVRAGLRIQGVPTSNGTLHLARKGEIPLTDFDGVRSLDVAIDGTDEFDPELNLIKGGGGALLREKIVASAADLFVVIADSRKQVPRLGAFPLPVEVIPFGWQLTATRVSELGAEATLRHDAVNRPFRTAGGNYILDCGFTSISDPAKLAEQLDRLVGVVEHGLFVGYADIVLMGRGAEVATFQKNAPSLR